MKKSRALSLITLLLASLVSSACNSGNNGSSNGPISKPSSKPNPNGNGNPSIDNVSDQELDLENSGFFDPLFLVEAWDPEDGDITSNLVVTIEDVIHNVEVEKIYLNSPGKYKVSYYVEDSDGNMVFSDCTITVGNPDATPEVNTCKALGYRYDINDLHYSLSWSEEFDYEGKIDNKTWTHEIGTGNWGWGNNEKQYYTDRAENIQVEDGKLRITALKENYKNSKYTSARIITRGKKQFKYGKFEASIKLPQGRGTWPAFWLLASKGGWPAGGEIDIMEAVGYQPNRAFGTLHTKDRNGGMDKGGIGKYIDVPTMYTDYHTYGVEWLPDGLRFYVDDTVYLEFFPAKQVECPDYNMWPFSDSEFYIILNVAIGGQWGGAQGIDDTIFDKYDVSMYIDYVRYYEAEEIKAFK